MVILFALIAMTGQAMTYKSIKNPEAMACLNVEQGELYVREIIMSDTATTLHFTIEYPKGQYFRFNKKSYLMDEGGNYYALHSAQRIKLGEWIMSPENGVTDFTLHFDPMPKQTQMFDFIESDVSDAFMLLGIHDKKHQIKAHTLQDLYASKPYTLPEDWFRPGTVTIRGRIKGYDAETFGFTAMECLLYDVMTKNNSTIIMDIEPDGSFEKRFPLSYPMKLSFIASDSPKVGLYEIPFFARPGETIDITVQNDGNERYECLYHNGTSKDVSRWLKSNLRLWELGYLLSSFQGKFNQANQVAERVWQNMLARTELISRRRRFTSEELHLALGEMQSIFANGVMNYAMYYGEQLTPWQQDGNGQRHKTVTDSAELRIIDNPSKYQLLKRIDFDNPLLMVDPNFHFTLNRMNYTRAYRTRIYTIDDAGFYHRRYGMESLKNHVQRGYEAYQELMGTNHNTLMSQLCHYKVLQESFDDWREQQEYALQAKADTTLIDSLRQKMLASLEPLNQAYPLYLSTFTHPFVRQQAEQFYQERMAQSELTAPLPDGPGIQIIRDLIARYPDRYLMIDFWDMSCGPCRAAIQSSKEFRQEIAKRGDVKLVFIAGERTVGGSDSYKKYVAEWLADEEAVCITNTDFRRLQELFCFNGIPHYETISPDGRRVREDLRLYDFDDFDLQLNRLKERLK